jgi:ribosomal protein S18 acetylase RimI-like enzyme
MTTLTASAPVIRDGDTTDLGAVTALYARCSDTTLYRRFHTPLPRMPQRLVHETLIPKDGWSLVAELEGVVVGLACLGGLSTYDVELGLIVDDACRRRGIGTGLLRRAAQEAAARGYRTLLCLAQCDNDAALRTLERSGLPTVSSEAGGLVRTVVPLSPAARPLPASA